VISGETDENGLVTFATDTENGVVLREHTPYYIKEISAPAGYVLSDAKYWFCFCGEKAEDGSYIACTFDHGIEDAANMVIINGDTDHVFNIENHLVTFVMPATGGRGSLPVYAAGAALVMAALGLTYMVYKRRKEGHGYR